MAAWNPSQYLKFDAERSRAAVDLCLRIQGLAPTRILDLGCGPGNSTRVLRERWPGARITGLDSSPEMIARAKESHPGGTWVLADAATWEGGTWDVLFSNAALQWMPEHGRLVPRLLGHVAPGGCLAAQMPAKGTPLRTLIRSVAGRPRWREPMAGAEDAMVFQQPGFYYDLLAPRCARVDLWETTYHHIMASHQAMIDWFEATGLRPYLDRLEDEAERSAFKGEVLEACRENLPAAANGMVLMPFHRLFFVGWV